MVVLMFVMLGSVVMNKKNVLRVAVVGSVFVSVLLRLLFEVKDGDWGWYVTYSNSVPSDHPMIYWILGFFRIFLVDGNLTVFVVEIIVNLFLIFFVFLVIEKLVGNYYFAGLVSFFISWMPVLQDGTPLKSSLGLGMFFMFFYFLLKRDNDFDVVWDTGRVNYKRIIILGVVYGLILLTHVVSTYLVLGLGICYLFRGFKFSREYFMESDFAMRGLYLVFALMGFWVLSQQDFIYNSNSKILFLSNFGIGNLLNNFLVINHTFFIGYEFIVGFSLLFWVLSKFVAGYGKSVKYDFVDWFLFIVCLFLMFGSVPYTKWTFQRFMGIIPYFVWIVFARFIRRVY